MTANITRKWAAQWAKLNPILINGEPGIEIDTSRMKVGDGRTRWSDLTFVKLEGGGGGTSTPYVLPEYLKEATLNAALGAKYDRPNGGIPEADLASALKTKLINAITQGQLDDTIAGIVGGAPQRLETLAELAGALNEDGDLSGTLNGLLAIKYSRPTGGIPEADLTPAARDAIALARVNANKVVALEATVNQLVNPPASPPSAMTLSLLAADGRITVSKTGGESTTSGGAATGTTYALYRGTTATGTPISTTFPFVDTGLPNGLAVSYIATAKNSQGTTTSAVVSATPTAVSLPAPTSVFRAADITGVSEGGFVSSVPAGLGAGPVWEQSDATVQPVFLGAYNGRPAIRCNNGWLRTATAIAYSGRGFVAARVWFDNAPNSTTDQGIAGSDDGPVSNAERLWRLSGAKAGLAKTIAWNNGTARTDTVTGLTGGAWHVVAARWASGVVETFIDGASDGATSGSISTVASRRIQIGASYVSGVTPVEKMNGYINEFRAYYQVLTTDEISAILADMGTPRVA